MSETLKVKNFGPIKNLEIELRKITLLIGHQASGKSTIAKLISIFKDFKFLAKPDKEKLQHFTLYNIENYFHENTFIEFTSEKYKVTYSPEGFNVILDSRFDEQIKQIKRAEYLQKRFQDIVDGKRPDMNKQFQEIMAQEVSKYVNEFGDTSVANSSESKNSKSSKFTKSIIFDKVKDKLIDEFAELIVRDVELDFYRSSEITHKSIYIPAERFLISVISDSIINLINSNILLPKSILEFGALFEIARKSADLFDINFLHLKFKLDNGVNKLFLDDNRIISLSECASGFQATIPLIIVIDYLTKLKDTYTFVVEEPELNLYPSMQKQILMFLIDKCTKSDNEVIITSHSPYIMSVFNNLLYANHLAINNPNKKDSISEVLPEKYWVNSQYFRAYFLKDGFIKPIVNDDTGLISDNELDDVSQEIAGELDTLMQYFN